MGTENSNFLIKSYYKGQTIFSEGQEAKTAYMVKSGTVTIMKTLDNSKQVVLGHIKEGLIFGEMGIISGAPRNATAVAEEYCELVVIDRDILNKTFLDSPKIVQGITKALTQRLNTASKRINALPSDNSFMGACAIIEFMHMTNSEIGPDGKVKGIPYLEVCAKLKLILSLSQVEINSLINKLLRVNVIQVIEEKAAAPNLLDSSNKEVPQRKNSNKFIKIPHPMTFMKTAGQFYNEFFKDSFTSYTDHMFIDIQEFAAMFDTTPEMVYKKIGAGEIPEEILFFHKRAAAEWIRNAGDTLKKER